jgi:hypothetical protein
VAYVYLLVKEVVLPCRKIPIVEVPAAAPVPIVIVNEVAVATVFPEYVYLSVLLGMLSRRKYA